MQLLSFTYIFLSVITDLIFLGLKANPHWIDLSLTFLFIIIFRKFRYWLIWLSYQVRLAFSCY